MYGSCNFIEKMIILPESIWTWKSCSSFCIKLFYTKYYGDMCCSSL